MNHTNKHISIYNICGMIQIYNYVIELNPARTPMVRKLPLSKAEQSFDKSEAGALQTVF